jgi:SAM-dependent methyltransferase
MDNTDQLIKSKHRVSTYGEVLTAKREVNAMLDLVKQETERIDSRFLEPACGTGNFLAVILERKLAVVERRYASRQYDYERYAFLAVSSIYGIDILDDNVKHCRDRLFGIFEASYLKLYKNHTKDDLRDTIRFVLNQNIIHGDAISLCTVGEAPQPIVFAEWSLFDKVLVKRRDFSYHSIIQNESLTELDLFSFISDHGEEVYIPKPVKEYPLMHFLELANVEH